MSNRLIVKMGLCLITITITITITIMIVVGGCETNEKVEKSGDASLAILYTTNGSGSEIEWLDDDLEDAGHSEYSFSAASFEGFMNMCEHKSQDIYIFPRGSYETKNYDKLVIINHDSGESSEIKTGKCNITGYDISGDKIAFTSNDGGINYVDVMDLSNGEQASMTLDGKTAFCIRWINDYLYSICMNDDLSYSLCEFNYHKKTEKKLLDLKYEEYFPDYLQVIGDSLIFVSEKQLFTYNTKTGKVDKTKLSRDDAYNLNVSDDMLLIGYTNIFESDYNSLLEARSLSSGDVICSTEIPGAINQIEKRDENIYVLGDTDLIQYEITKKGFNQINKKNIDKKYLDTGGLFLLK